MSKKTTNSLSELKEQSIHHWNEAVRLTAEEKTAWAKGDKRAAAIAGNLAWQHYKDAVLCQQEYLAFGGKL